MIGFAIAIACFQGYVNTPHMEAIKTTTKNLFNI